MIATLGEGHDLGWRLTIYCRWVKRDGKTWRRLMGENQLPKVVRGVKFHNGVEVIETPAHNAA